MFDFLQPPWTAACQASLSFTTSLSLLRFMSIELVMLSNHLILCRPLLLLFFQFSSVTQCVWLFMTPWMAVCQAFLFINSGSLLKLMSIESVMLSNHIILCHPLLFLPSIFSSIRVFSNESVLHIGWPKYRSFSFSISPSKEYSGLISFRINWLDLLAVQETLKSLLQQMYSNKELLHCLYSIWKFFWCGCS